MSCFPIIKTINRVERTVFIQTCPYLRSYGLYDLWHLPVLKSCLMVNNGPNHNYNKIVKSDWLSTALISALIGQFNRTVRVMPK